MNTASFLLLVAAAVMLAGLVKTVFGLIQAPEGFEDDTGFHHCVDTDHAAHADRFIRGLGNAKMM